MAWIKALHLISLISWFAGIFYLPRLFVYHAMSSDQISHDRFVIMERKLFRGIMTPAAVVTVATGVWMISLIPEFYLQQGWLHAKLLLVALVIAYHISCGWFIRRFRDGRNTHGHVFFRFYNEAPVFALAGIVILAVVKPF